MPYTVQQLATLAGVSVRTLHHYDQVGLLKPARVKNNGYRYYEEPELLRLQQILFFKELEFPLEDIMKILTSPSFNMEEALKDQRQLIELKKDRLTRLIKTIDKTIKKINKQTNMEDQELYGNFSKEEMEKYNEEAKEKWGHTEAYKQSTERVKKMGKDGLNKVLAEAGKLTEEIAGAMKAGDLPTSDKVQKLIARHYDGLRAFYEPNLEIYRGLAEMYVADPRFKANYEKVAEGLAEYIRDGMVYYADTKSNK
jgi:DNA-binding transcriptional MerR regulator